MDSKKFGKYFYFGSLILAVVAFIVGRVLLTNQENLEQELYIRYSNLIQFAIFGIIVPIGVIVREYLLLPYLKNFMTAKVIIYSLVSIGGLVLFFAVPTVSVSSVLIYVSYAALIFILVPTNAFRKFDK